MKGVSQHDINCGQRILCWGLGVNVIRVSVYDCLPKCAGVPVRMFACLHVIECSNLVSDGKKERESKKDQE